MLCIEISEESKLLSLVMYFLFGMLGCYNNKY